MRGREIWRECLAGKTTWITMIQRRRRAGKAEGRNIKGSTPYYRLIQALRLSAWQSQALQNCCTQQSAWQTWVFPHHFHWGLVLVCLRRSPSTTEQEQDERAWITVLARELPIHTGHEFDSHFQDMLCSCALTFIGQETQNEDLNETGYWLFSGLQQITKQPITNHQPSNKYSLFSMPDPDLTLSNSKQHTSVSRLQAHLLAAMILDPFQTGSRP